VNSGISGYARFRENQLIVLEALNSALTAFQSLDMNGAVETAARLVRRLKQDSFKVLVLGEFKRGKSTFINALLGAEILPAYATPCTAVINEIKWGSEKRAVLHFRTDMLKDVPSGVPPEIRAHIEKHNNGGPPPLDIPIERLEEFVVIPDPSKDAAASVSETPYKLVEIFWPIELCRNGVILIDSPGLNEHQTRTNITTHYLSEADAVIFVLSCHALGGQSEMHVVEHDIRGSGHEQVFFVCNRFDEIREGERERVVEYARAKLTPKTAFGQKGVYFISALNALDGKTAGNVELLKASGMRPLEDDLSRFLVEQRGKVKLMQPVRELLLQSGRAVADTIPSQTRMLDQSLERLEEKHRAIQPHLVEAEERRKRIMERVTVSRSRIRDDVRREMRARIREVAGFIPGWLEGYETQETIKFISLDSAKAQAGAVIREAVEFVSRKLEEEQLRWRNEFFQPFLLDRLQELGSDIQTPLEELLQGLDKLRAVLVDTETETIVKRSEVHPMERILAAAGGLVVGGYGSALVGGILGYTEMLKSLIPAIGAYFFLTLIVGVTNPIVLIGLLLGAGTIQGLLSVKSATRKLVQAAGDELVRKVRESADTTAESIAESINDRTQEIASLINSGMEREIQDIRDQVESVLREKRQGETAVAARKDELVETSRALGGIQKDLNELVFALA
jgi:GTPase Era involved in 16S rRNA processing